MEKLIKAGHLRRYIREIGHRVELGQAANRVTVVVVTLSESRPTINYILSGPSNYRYQSKRQHKKLLRVAIVKARINAIQGEGRHEETKPIDDPISFPFINPNKVIVPHYDALVLTLCINSFGVHKVLIDLGSVTNLLQLLAFKQMKFSLGVMNTSGRIISGFNDATIITLGDVVLPVKVGSVT